MFLYYFIIAPLSRLPYWVLYRISDVLFYLVYYCIPYRKKVVLQNLKNSFPAKSESEIDTIARKFYRHLCDLVVESLKAFSITQEEALERFKCLNPELPNKYFDQGKSVILVGGHYNNWELLALAIDEQIKHKTIAIYQPLNDKFMDQIMRKTRGRYGLRMISTKIVKQVFEEEKANLTATIFANDQSPGNTTKCHWMTFLNQDTPVLYGAEKYAREYGHVPLFGKINKVKRGYYTFELVEFCPDPKAAPHAFITEQSTRMLEAQILDKPEFWLWSHRRWKHKRPKTTA